MISEPAADTYRPTEFDRRAVITIQGGAIYGFTMLGQLSELVTKHRIVPAAIAANSAGAIVATLYWAGYKPLAIRDLFVELADRDELMTLLGPGRNASAIRGGVERSYKRMTRVGRSVDRWVKPREQRTWPEFFRAWTTDWVQTPWRVWRESSNYYKRKGVFEGVELEARIDRWIRDSPSLKEFSSELAGINGLLRFGDVSKIFKKHAGEVYFPPLMLTATSVASRKLVVFNSFEEKYGGVPIAAAVRASAGFPGFFQPVEVAGAPELGPYVDGGMITNYPAWVFSSDLREKLAKTDQYRPLSAVPWLHIGLRVIWEGTVADKTDPSPRAFVRGMKDLFLGGARTQLEDRMGPATQSVVIPQPQNKTGGPEGFLDIKSINGNTICKMVELAEEFAGKELSKISFELPDDAQIEPILRDLVGMIAKLLGDPANQKLGLRSNIFLAWEDRLILRYAVNMDGDDDRNMNFHFTEGLTGFAYMRRCPHVCNLERIGNLIRDGKIDRGKMFGMSPEHERKVKSDRTFLASVPILDPAAVFVTDLGEPWSERPVAHLGKHYQFDCNPVDGAIFGVLNVDSSLKLRDFGLSDSTSDWTDIQVKGILDLMHAASWKVGRQMSLALGAKNNA